MKIISTNVYVGPNIYAHFPSFGTFSTSKNSRRGQPAGWAMPLSCRCWTFSRACTSTAAPTANRAASCAACRKTKAPGSGHVMEHIALELQNIAGSSVTFGRTRSVEGQPGHYTMVFQYLDAEVGREASRLALALIHSLLPAELKPSSGAPDDDWDFASERDEFIRYAQARAFGPEHRFAGARRRRARHPLDSFESAKPGAVWSRPLPAAHPGHDHQSDEQYRR